MSADHLPYPPTRAIGYDGMYPRERAIMDLRDKGMQVPKIAAQLGLNEKSVSNIVKLNEHKPCSFERMIRQGSADLAAAILRHHPERAGL